MRIRSSSRRQEELGAAGIALAAGAAAQLVVDAPALVPLGADDEQAAGVEHLLPLGLDLGSDRRRPAARSRLVLDAAAPARMRISALPPSWMSVPRPAMLVAMVTAADPPGLGDDVAPPARGSGRSAPGAGSCAFLSRLGEMLGLLDRDRADQDRLRRSRARPRSPRRSRRSSRARCGRPRRPRPCGSSAGGSGSRPRSSR